MDAFNEMADLRNDDNKDAKDRKVCFIKNRYFQSKIK
jgi:hypothetical protein